MSNARQQGADPALILHLYDLYVGATTPDDDEIVHHLKQTLTNQSISQSFHLYLPRAAYDDKNEQQTRELAQAEE